MGERCRTLLFVLCCAVLRCAAQPPNDACADALTVCAQQPLAGDNTGAVAGSTSLCFSSRALWYSFHTNSVGGAVNVAVTDIDCPAVPGRGTELAAVVLSGDGTCSLPGFLAASPCAQGDAAFTLTSFPLAPNTEYWITVGGLLNGGATVAAQCPFQLTLSGPGANIVDVDLDAGESVEIPLGGNTQLDATSVNPAVQWSPTSGLSGNTILDPVAAPVESTVYSIATTLNGCTYSDSVAVSVVRLIDPPNTITPNGDGINDTWEIFGINDYPEADVSIFDRWGQRVFHSVGYREPFDGKSLPTATYYWHIALNNVQGRSDPYTGYITIVN